MGLNIAKKDACIWLNLREEVSARTYALELRLMYLSCNHRLQARNGDSRYCSARAKNGICDL